MQSILTYVNSYAILCLTAYKLAQNGNKKPEGLKSFLKNRWGARKVFCCLPGHINTPYKTCKVFKLFFKQNFRKGGVQMVEYKGFGLKARMAMLSKGISSYDIARQLEISPQYVLEIIKGTRPGKKYKPLIADILSIKYEA